MKNVSWLFVLILCLTLGLTPFVPIFKEEPHIWDKLKWIAGGATGMQFMDWLDVLFHGFPWLLLAIKVNSTIFSKLSH